METTVTGENVALPQLYCTAVHPMQQFAEHLNVYKDLSTSIHLDTSVPNIWNITLPNDWGASELEGECLRLISPVDAAPGRATEHPPPPSHCPCEPVREEGPPLLTCQLQTACLLLPQSFDTKIVQEASVLKMPQQTLILRIEGGKRKKEVGKRENTRELEYYQKKENERKQKEKNYLIAQHRSALQNTEVILFSLTSVCIERILIDLSLGAWMK